MSPQPANAPAPEAEKPEEKTITEEVFERINAIPADERDIPEVQFMRAVALEKRKSDLLKEINANREFLRIMSKSEALDVELSDWLEVFYPTKEKDSKRDRDEVTETRKNHEAAARAKVSK